MLRPNQLHTDATLRITVIVLHSISAVSIHARDYPREPFVPALKERFDGIVHLEFASSVAGGLRRWYRRVRERNLERALLSLDPFCRERIDERIVARRRTGRFLRSRRTALTLQASWRRRQNRVTNMPQTTCFAAKRRDDDRSWLRPAVCVRLGTFAQLVIVVVVF